MGRPLILIEGVSVGEGFDIGSLTLYVDTPETAPDLKVIYTSRDSYTLIPNYGTVTYPIRIGL